MNRTEHLLSCLAEECAEVAQRVSKALRFGLSEVQPGQPFTNAERIQQECIDLLAVLEMLDDAEVVARSGGRELDDLLSAKKAKIEKFMRYAEEQGALT